ncbi:glycosyltransferase family 2 protein [Flavobacterium lacus]|uniref:Glycosyl transferase family 2 n=1 Tax=Flavobacterium lacus TaxID=1353778 RepID=A0A328WY42_9FLAO|nr:glycosyltransferase family 2 protein [Flavobacterium lacus]RAR51132.1 glycosyl transferase family 2 [Flavobacterium lacus]
MEQRKIFSVIVPVYNVETFLHQCIDSILKQTFTNFELLLINDGSSDSSAAICLAYQKNDDRIKLINQENGGASSARNNGIHHATGDYLIFVDSDDFLDSDDLFYELSQTIQKHNADVVLYGGKNYNVSSNNYSISRGNYDLTIIKSFSLIQTFEYLIQKKLFPGSAWVYTTKAKLIKENGIFFRTKIIAEDIDWNTKIFGCVSSIDAVNDLYYVYRKNQVNSVTGNAGVKGINSILLIIEDWLPKLEIENKPVNSFLLHNLAYYYFTILVLYSAISADDKIKLKQRLKNCFVVTKYSRTVNLKVLRFFCQLLGIPLTSAIVSKLYYLKERYI